MKKTSVAVIAVLSALTVGTGVLAMMSAQATVPKRLPTADHVTSEEYMERQKNPVSSEPVILTEEEKVIVDKRDELIEFYHQSLEKELQQYGGKADGEQREQAQLKTDEQLILRLAQETIEIFKKYGMVDAGKSVDDYEEARDLINMSCEALEKFPLNLEEQATLKFFINQTYDFVDLTDDTFAESVKRRVDLTGIKYIDVWSVPSNAELPEISEEESSR